LTLDFVALPFFGFLAQKFSKEKMMLLASFTLLISTIFLFSLLKNASINTAIIIRSIFVLIGIWFSAPMHHMAQEIAPIKNRTQIITIGYALGSQIIGAPSCALGLFLYKKTNLVFAPGFYLMFFSFLSFIFIYHYSFKKLKDVKLEKAL
jgi:MHS family proline/betaine transporter-like MFS transporter